MGYSSKPQECEVHSVIEIPTGSPGKIPAGAKLYRDDRTHLAQAETRIQDGLRVHPLTIALGDEAITVLDRLPHPTRFALPEYKPGGTLSIRVIGEPTC